MKYSKADLLGEELFLASGEASWKYKMLYRLLKSKRVALVIHIPHTYFARLIVFCDDIERLTGEKIEVVRLLNILVRDFVYELARNTSGPLPAFRYLMDRYTKILQVAHYRSENVEEFDLYEKKTESLSKITVEVLNKEILRLEWFLSDLEAEVQNHGFTVEKIMEILLCHLIELVKRGEAEKAIKEIIKSIEKED